MTVSEELNVASGVPQESILGPQLFAIHTADLQTPVNYDSKVHQYVDDTQLCIRCTTDDIPETVHLLNVALQRLSERSRNHCLVINP